MNDRDRLLNGIVIVVGCIAGLIAAALLPAQGRRRAACNRSLAAHRSGLQHHFGHLRGRIRQTAEVMPAQRACQKRFRGE